MRYVLDSNVILFYIRDSKTKQFLEDTYDPFGKNNTAIISIASVAEIMSTAKQNRWGDKKIEVVKKLISSLVVIEIRYSDLIDAYTEIDAYSQGKLPNRLLKMSSRNMGKNDLWIAATTYITGSKLLTSDKDFDHLDGEFFEVSRFERQNLL